MSKETMSKIREAEAEADRLIAEAEAKAAQMRADADAEGKKLCEETEREVTLELSRTLEQFRIKSEELTQRTLEEGAEEAEEILSAARFNRKVAEKLVIRGLDAKCR